MGRPPAVPTGALTASLLAHIVLAMALLAVRPARLPTDPPPISIEVMAVAADTSATTSEPMPATPAAPDAVALPVPTVYNPPPPAEDDARSEPTVSSTVAPDAAIIPEPEAAVAAIARPPVPKPLAERVEPRRKPARRPATTLVDAPMTAPTPANPAVPLAGAGTPPAPMHPAPDPIWQHELLAWLAAHKHYPEQARANNEQGAVGVAFTVARDGRVEAVRIDRSSGTTVLDQSVVEMLANRHVPPFSPSMTGERTLVRVTIHFELDH